MEPFIFQGDASQLQNLIVQIDPNQLQSLIDAINTAVNKVVEMQFFTVGVILGVSCALVWWLIWSKW